jgi:glycine reductase
MATLRVVHYLNQFFAGIGAEDRADTPPSHREGPIGPGRVLQQALGDRGDVVATVYCGDNYAGEKSGAIDEILDLIVKHRPEIVIAGPAFSAGRYGLACGEVALRARERLGVIAVTGMHVENAATEVYRTRLHIASTQRTAAGMADGLATMARLAVKLASGTPLGSPADEGYVPTGRRIFEVAERPAPLRAVEMLLRKIRGEPYTTEWPIPRYHRVPASPPLQGTAKATIALVTTGGLVPHGNPDRLESGFATKWLRYSIVGVDSLPPERWQSVHGGFNTSRINEDPHRVLPLDVARELEGEGVIGRLHPEFYSTTGNTSVIPTMRRFAQEMAHKLRAAGVDGVILTST